MEPGCWSAVKLLVIPVAVPNKELCFRYYLSLRIHMHPILPGVPSISRNLRYRMLLHRVTGDMSIFPESNKDGRLYICIYRNNSPADVENNKIE